MSMAFEESGDVFFRGARIETFVEQSGQDQLNKSHCQGRTRGFQAPYSFFQDTRTTFLSWLVLILVGGLICIFTDSKAKRATITVHR